MVFLSKIVGLLSSSKKVSVPINSNKLLGIFFSTKPTAVKKEFKVLTVLYSIVNKL